MVRITLGGVEAAGVEVGGAGAPEAVALVLLLAVRLRVVLTGGAADALGVGVVAVRPRRSVLSKWRTLNACSVMRLVG